MKLTRAPDIHNGWWYSLDYIVIYRSHDKELDDNKIGDIIDPYHNITLEKKLSFILENISSTMHNTDLNNKKDNPLKYDIHPLDFIRAKTIEAIENTLEIDQETPTIGFSPSDKNHSDTLDEAYWGTVEQEKALDEFWREFWDWCFPW